MEKEYMNWEKFQSELSSLADKIDYKPDLIVGITRGGIIPARFLSNLLDVKEMYCISVKKFGEERRVMTEILEDLVGKKILLVEDMLETGRSLIVAKNYLESKGAIVKTSCMYTWPISEIKPDFYLRQVKIYQVFPWEKQ